MIIVPKRELPSLIDKHRAGLMENHHLTKAARFAAKKERILADPTLTAEEKQLYVAPVSTALHRATKKIRTLDVPSAGEVVDEQQEKQADSELTSSAFDKWMRRMARIAKKAEPQTPKGKLSTPTSIKPAIPKKSPSLRTPTGIKPPIPKKSPPLLKTPQRTALPFV